jgi:transmembrane protein EpsG
LYTYLILGLIVIFLSFLNRYKNGEDGLALSFFLIFLFSALRYNFGNDYFSYLLIYNEINQDISYSLSGASRHELGWVIINIIFGKLSFEALIFFTSFINCVLFYFFIKKNVTKKLFYFALIIYYFDTNFFLINLSAIRQSIAILLVLSSLEYLAKKKHIKFLITFILALNFHNSALVLFPVVIFFYNFNGLLTPIYVTLFSSIYFTTYLLKNYLQQYVLILTNFFFANRYSTEYSDSDMSIVNFISYLVLLIFLFYYHNKFEKKYQFYLKLLIFGIVIIPVDFIIPLTARITYYFMTLSIIVFPKLLSLITDYKIKIMFLILIFSVMIIRLINFFNSDTYSVAFGDYHTIFFPK